MSGQRKGKSGLTQETRREERLYNLKSTIPIPGQGAGAMVGSHVPEQQCGDDCPLTFAQGTQF